MDSCMAIKKQNYFIFQSIVLNGFWLSIVWYGLNRVTVDQFRNHFRYFFELLIGNPCRYLLTIRKYRVILGLIYLRNNRTGLDFNRIFKTVSGRHGPSTQTNKLSVMSIGNLLSVIVRIRVNPIKPFFCKTDIFHFFTIKIGHFIVIALFSFVTM